MNKLTKLLQKQTIICAEGYLFELERRGYLKAGAYVPEVVLDQPEIVKQLHREFLRAGSDVIEAFTYYAHREKLKTIGRENDLEPLNKKALQIAKEVATEGQALLAGNISNTWLYDYKNPKKSEKQIRPMFEEQVAWAKEAEVDYIIAETIENLGEALLALQVIKEYNLPAVITLSAVTFDDQTADGYPWEEACYILQEQGADVVGLNCSRGPATMYPILEKIQKKVSIPIAALPVPYHTTKSCPAFQHLKDEQGHSAFPIDLDPFLLSRNQAAHFALKAQEMGIKYIGLCCGAAAHHIRAMAEALGRQVPASRYSPDLSQHGMLGDQDITKKHNTRNKKLWTRTVD